MSPSRRVVTLSFYVAALASCSDSSETTPIGGDLGGPAKEEPNAGFPCVGALCTCTGDGDCDTMFGSGTCGDFSSCDATGAQTECKCVALRARNGTKHPPGWRPFRTHEHR